MATLTITDPPSGQSRSVTIDGANPPTDADIHEIHAHLFPNSPMAAPAAGRYAATGSAANLTPGGNAPSPYAAGGAGVDVAGIFGSAYGGLATPGQRPLYGPLSPIMSGGTLPSTGTAGAFPPSSSMGFGTAGTGSGYDSVNAAGNSNAFYGQAVGGASGSANAGGVYPAQGGSNATKTAPLPLQGNTIGQQLFSAVQQLAPKPTQTLSRQQTASTPAPRAPQPAQHASLGDILMSAYRQAQQQSNTSTRRATSPPLANGDVSGQLWMPGAAPQSLSQTFARLSGQPLAVPTTHVGPVAKTPANFHAGHMPGFTSQELDDYGARYGRDSSPRQLAQHLASDISQRNWGTWPQLVGGVLPVEAQAYADNNYAGPAPTKYAPYSAIGKAWVLREAARLRQQYQVEKLAQAAAVANSARDNPDNPNDTIADRLMEALPVFTTAMPAAQNIASAAANRAIYTHDANAIPGTLVAPGLAASAAQQRGFMPAVESGLLSATEPTNLAMMLAVGGASEVGLLPGAAGRLLGGAFAAQQVPGIARRVWKGDGWGAVGAGLVGIGPVALGEGLRATAGRVAPTVSETPAGGAAAPDAVQVSGPHGYLPSGTPVTYRGTLETPQGPYVRARTEQFSDSTGNSALARAMVKGAPIPAPPDPAPVSGSGDGFWRNWLGHAETEASGQASSTAPPGRSTGIDLANQQPPLQPGGFSVSGSTSGAPYTGLLGLLARQYMSWVYRFGDPTSFDAAGQPRLGGRTSGSANSIYGGYGTFNDPTAPSYGQAKSPLNSGQNEFTSADSQGVNMEHLKALQQNVDAATSELELNLRGLPVRTAIYPLLPASFDLESARGALGGDHAAFAVDPTTFEPYVFTDEAFAKLTPNQQRIRIGHELGHVQQWADLLHDHLHRGLIAQDAFNYHVDAKRHNPFRIGIEYHADKTAMRLMFPEVAPWDVTPDMAARAGLSPELKHYQSLEQNWRSFFDMVYLSHSRLPFMAESIADGKILPISARPSSPIVIQTKDQ